jgi:ABC-type uncharacterized transport system auxiliary subunit
MVSLLALAACGSIFQSKKPAAAIYILSVKAVPSGSEIPADLTVFKPRVRTGLNNDLIAVLYPDRRLDNFAAARWSGPLDEMLQDLAMQAFRLDVKLRNVHGDASMFGGGYWLEIFVEDFQAEYTSSAGGPDAAAPTVHVHLLAKLGSSSDRRVLGRFEADTRQPATENRLTAVIDAYNRAAEAALAQIVADTSKTLTSQLATGRQ